MLTRVGAHCPEKVIDRLEAAIRYLQTGRWLRDKGFVVPPRAQARDEVFEAVAQEVRDKQVLYLEFGVYEGDSFRFWSSHLRNSGSHLHGFDSFEGLPETWTSKRPRGYFSTGGRIPRINDSRVKFFKGWFHETLPQYDPPHHEQLIINIDADLYSSAKLILATLKSHIVVGTYLYFDEFCFPRDELKAFDEFLTESNARFIIVAAYRDLSGVMFRRIA